MPTVRSLVAFVFVAAAAGGVTVLGWRTLLSTPAPAPPALESPAQVDLGPRETGSVAIGRFRVMNRGGSELRLTQFATSCSCAGVEIDQNGGPKRAEELWVPPGGAAELSVRIAVGSRAGSNQIVFVNFSTNDPARPDVTVQVTIPQITGGLSADPTAVVFGDLPLGQQTRKTVRLYSNGSATRRVHAVRSLNPDRFDAHIVPAATDNSVAPNRLIAAVEVTARTDRPGKLDGVVEVVLNEDGRATDRIAVLGEVVPPVVAKPGAVVLPRFVAGRPEYAAPITLTGRDSALAGVTVEAVPDGLTAAVRPDPDDPGRWRLDVTAEPDGRTPRTVAVRLRAGTIAFEVPVIIHPVNP